MMISEKILNDTSIILITKKLHEFSDYIVASPIKGNNIGLMGGDAGEILFLCYYSRYFKNEDILDRVSNKLKRIFENINSGNNYSTLADGICGICWLIEHLVEEDFINYDLQELYESTDEFLNECMIHFIRNNNYDYLHGALGIANYFLNRNTLKTNEYLFDFISLLYEKAITNTIDKSIGFKSIVHNTGQPMEVFNFCLSHGMASLIYFLQRALLKDNFKNNSETNNLIRGIQIFFNKYQNDLSRYNSYFPTWISNSKTYYDSRMAWCYGDVGIGITFLGYGKNHNNIEIENYGNRILMNTLNRKNIKEEAIEDAGICHGSSGLSLIYEEAYHLTGEKEYLEASDYWLSITLNQAIHSTGICGYKSYSGNDNWTNETGLLEGISGIGMVLLSKLDGNLRNWKKSLMIS